jgi:hypothetical protein
MKSFVIIIFVVMFVGCSVEANVSSKPNKRSEVEHISDIGFRVYTQVITVEGHKYVVTNEGGITHSESCKCKGRVK